MSSLLLTVEALAALALVVLVYILAGVRGSAGRRRDRAGFSLGQSDRVGEMAGRDRSGR